MSGVNVEISVVVPVCNEAENVEPLAREIHAALGQRAYEMIFVDDGSTDDTAANLRRLKNELPALRVLSHSFRSGQSAARDENRGVQLLMGNRKASRKDTAFRKLQSSIANGVRSGLLGDGTPDTGCGIKLFSRDVFMELPRFDHMHRFLPALFMRQGARVISIPVSHRPRTRGSSKYGMLNRLWVGIIDIGGVMWLRRRYKSGLLVRED